MDSGLSHWFGWLVGGLVLFAFATVFTFVWWKVGDQWADAEHKRFGRGKSEGEGSGKGPEVIRGFGEDEDGDGE